MQFPGKQVSFPPNRLEARPIYDDRFGTVGFVLGSPVPGVAQAACVGALAGGVFNVAFACEAGLFPSLKGGM